MTADENVALDFRGAMRRLAASVTIISTNFESGRHAMTATAVTSVSVTPPALLVCVNQKALLHDLLKSNTRFCVNILHREQAELSRVFSGQVQGEQRFSMSDWKRDDHGIPFLVGAQANVFCAKTMEIPYASHSLFIGDTYDVMLRDDISPLVYRDGQYAMCAQL